MRLSFASLTYHGPRASILFMGLLLLTFYLQGCAYQFTNASIKRPEGIRTIAVESIFDTSAEVLPHEALWESLQKAFVVDGNLRLVPQSSADALLRAHLREASIAAIGSPTLNPPRKDPKVFAGALPATPSEFKPLAQAGEIRGVGVLKTVINVELWSLKTKALLFKRTYTMMREFRTVHSTSKLNNFLRHEEAIDARFRDLSQDLAQQVVRDVLIP